MHEGMTYNDLMQCIVSHNCEVVYPDYMADLIIDRSHLETDPDIAHKAFMKFYSETLQESREYDLFHVDVIADKTGKHMIDLYKQSQRPVEIQTLADIEEDAETIARELVDYFLNILGIILSQKEL